MSLSVFAILILNLILSFISSEANLRRDSESKFMLTAQQIAAAIDQSRYSSDYVERQIAQKLRTAALIAADKLGPDIEQIETSDLAELSRLTGVSGFSLMVQRQDDIVVTKSTDPKEIGISTKNWGYWYKALKQLFARQSVEVQQGQSFKDFWSGPFDISFSNPNNIDKWGYYQDGKRNYLINPFIRSSDIEEYHQAMSPEGILQKTMEVNSGIVEITGINPDQFILHYDSSLGKRFGNQFGARNRPKPLLFGTYQMPGDQTVKLTQEALEKKQTLINNMTYNGKRYIESFVPITKIGKEPYVIRMLSNDVTLSTVLWSQLRSQVIVSLVLFIIVVLVCYFFACRMIRPIQDILVKVNDMANGQLDARLQVRRRDELGLLAERINVMACNLGGYTEKLRQKNEENRFMREHLESVINQTADAIQLTDLEGRTLRINKAFEQLFGWEASEVVGSRLQFIPPELQAEWDFRDSQLHSGHQLGAAETRRRCKDGTEIEVSISQSPIVDEQGQITSFISIYRDMTEHNKMEELLRRSEKLTTVGQLAAGVAHEIRNPLTTLRGFLQLQQSSGKVSPQHTDLMLSELDRINMIVSEFLILAKPQATHFQIKDIRYIMGDVISLLDSMAHMYGIQFLTDFAKEPLYVHCEENQLKQVFINLLKNAVEAMPQGGMIGLEIKAEEDQVKVWIVDEGEGVPKEMLSKLGEPFFTSKEHGTGLGLMVSQRIIEVHKGTLVIDSVVGWGTLVTISLPKIQPEEAQQPV
ncbi:ATP-binding protein [Paenibacillus sp. CAA11]|uniref:ATP-binding protein n=1 Tax=Paenibacillus sp. CAA11 TaxID=1532905 RepID=UPI001F160C47|nr:ATP-binding protein [Paenibacillus sp. CAA11]